ncbi:MAG: LysM peptidoglycan-binding domain-containing protein [Desulfobacterales bacterium]|nr:LysM peptidoglycan-binding domain-containing protein [Desulfobacterales bacterium]
MNTRDTASMAPAPSNSAENTPTSPVDIDENVYQNGNDDDIALMGADELAAKVDAEAADRQAAKSPQRQLDEALEFCRASQEYWQRGELEKAVDSLDQAYALILEVEAQDDFKLIQEKEDLRFMISKRILEIYASRNIVVNGNHNAIPLEMNRHVQAEIKRFTVGPEKTFFLKSLKRSGRYRPEILKALREAGLPEELSWLPLIESGFNVKALSRARALGLWQFIPSTGYKFGLKRDQFIDERMDPEKATTAAIAYLKELHNIFGDWTTVLAAYNCGEGRVLRTIRTQNVNYLDNFWDLYERLPRETARYVPRFLATLHILNAPDKYGIDLGIVDPPLTYETVTVAKQVSLRDAARAIGTTEFELRQINPELRYKISPPRSYELKVPVGRGDTLLAQIDSIKTTTLPRPAYVYHRVRSGETLSTIARRYRTSVSRIMRANNLRSSHYIVAGKRLKIPQRGYTHARRPARNKTVRKSDQAQFHTVGRGDSLWNIARQYGTTTEAIQKLNGLRGTRLHKGQVLKISEGKPSAPVNTDQLKTYQVKTGDSPFKIAQLHKMSLDRLLQINRLSHRSKIYPGQELYVE